MGLDPVRGDPVRHHDNGDVQGVATLPAIGDGVRTWPLVHSGEHVGELVAAPPHGSGTVDEQDALVLATVAELVGGLVRAETLTRDLQDARHRLVAAREEERRRLRRDLHDGLGPLLTGLGLNLDAAAAHLGRDGARSPAYLRNAQDASRQVISSLRDVAHGLRPPALDELGFAGAPDDGPCRSASQGGEVVGATARERAAQAPEGGPEGVVDVGGSARSAHRWSSWSGSAITRWATRKALFAAGTPQ